jgi:hypothetical protein
MKIALDYWIVKVLGFNNGAFLREYSTSVFPDVDGGWLLIRTLDGSVENLQIDSIRTIEVRPILKKVGD